MHPNADTSTGARRMAEAARYKTLYEALEALPECLIGEILDGQLHTMPRPRPPHAVAASKLTAKLMGPYADGAGGPGGWWIVVEPEIHFIRKTEVLVPDLAGWRRERMPELPSDYFDLAPDWVCEILSPSTRSKDREIKMPIYARYGVAHAWLIDPRTRVLEAYELRDAGWTEIGVYNADDVAAAEPFPAASFRVADLWQ